MLNFNKKVAVITGAAGALGSVAATALANAGAKLVLVDIDQKGISDQHAELIRNGARALGTDLTQAQSVNDMAQSIRDEFGRVDVLINIAGGFSMGPRLHEVTDKDWDFMFNLNARSVFLTCRSILPIMLEQGSGKIVNVAARAATQGKAKMGPYCASKAVVMRLTESMAAEYRVDNINVNCILPGTIDTTRNRDDMPGEDFSRWVPPKDLVDVILFLASDAARGVHGAAVPVYGLS